MIKTGFSMPFLFHFIHLGTTLSEMENQNHNSFLKITKKGNIISYFSH
ncbi:hypothetical protein [Chryseobacterium phosphatilyticum]|nr:hypothetical protein [Chryseobacterium phosphatilyticum]